MDFCFICRYSTGKIPNAALLEGIAIRLGCQHGLRFTMNIKILRYYNALAWIMVPPHGIELSTNSGAHTQSDIICRQIPVT